MKAYIINIRGALAQLGERKVRNLEVRGSIPLCSTIHNRWKNYIPAVFSLFIISVYSTSVFLVRISANSTAGFLWLRIVHNSRYSYYNDD